MRFNSFKERGARYALLNLTEEQKRKGVISASLGNHALALSYHGWKLSIPVTVVMPTAAPIMKIQKCRNYKARVVVEGRDMGEAKRLAMKMSYDEQLLYVNGYDHPDIMAGQGTIGLEILEQVPKPDAVVVPVGGGGLIAGIATAVKALSPTTKIIVSQQSNLPPVQLIISHSLTLPLFVRVWNRRSVPASHAPWRTRVPSAHPSRILWPMAWLCPRWA